MNIISGIVRHYDIKHNFGSLTQTARNLFLLERWQMQSWKYEENDHRSRTGDE